MSMNGGCTARECCADGAYYCSTSDSRTPISFPRVRAIREGEHGSCYKSSTTQAEYCTVYGCGGATICTEGTCVITGDGTVLKTNPIVAAGGTCPLDAP